MVTLTPGQRDKVIAEKGFSPSRIRPVYQEPDGATSQTGMNLALRTSDTSAEIYLEFLVSDEDAKARIAYEKERGEKTLKPRINPRKYLSYIVDYDGRVWKFLPTDEITRELKREKKKLGQVFLHSPSSLVAADSIASRDTLRKLKRLLEQLEVGSYDITKKAE